MPARQSPPPPPDDRGTVLVVHSSDEMYGADRILLEVVGALRDLAGLRVQVWLPAGVGDGTLTAELTRRGFAVEHHPLPILRRANLSARGLAELARVGWVTGRLLRRRRFGAVYLMTSACLPVAPLARLAGTRHVLVHLQEMWSGVDRMVLRGLATFCTAVIAISTPVAQASGLRRWPPVDVVENGVSLPAETCEAVPISGPRPRYLVASRWNTWKGHETLLRAWDLAGCPGTLVVLGAPPPVGAGVDVRALANDLVAHPETVDVVGQVESIGPYLAAADVLVLPSDQPEPFGLVIIEAFGRSRPAIASRGGGPLHIITDGVDGWFFDLGSAPALAGLLRQLDPAALRRAGERARQTYLDRYTPESYRRRIAATVRNRWRRA
ncbi:glycosyltransferase family 4 protein [Nakamurella sp.]|uniref:glycosyltransferase family 4 protein n=1 Tax=Nakamurella sp. TaxID=1869182 RepID=UPI0037850D29